MGWVGVSCSPCPQLAYPLRVILTGTVFQFFSYYKYKTLQSEVMYVCGGLSSFWKVNVIITGLEFLFLG